MKNCILLLTCLNILFCSYSQNNNCSNTKRYEVEKGCLVYKVQTKRNSDKNWRTEKEIKISFSEFGKIQNHQILKCDSNNNIDSTMDSEFFIDYFVKDKCSVYFKGISLIKPKDVYFKRKKAIKYVQFRFKDINSVCYLGTVTYYKGIPVLIDGFKYTCDKSIDKNNVESFYWKLISKLPSDVVKKDRGCLEIRLIRHASIGQNRSDEELIEATNELKENEVTFFKFVTLRFSYFS